MNFMLNGKPYNGPMHKMPDGSMHTGKIHTKNSKLLTHSTTKKKMKVKK